MLRVDLGADHRCLSSAVLGGGLGFVRTWVNLQVPSNYARTDPDRHLADATAGLPGPVVGMLTAAAVARFQDAEVDGARVFATVGLGHPVAAAGAAVPAPASGTINIFAIAPCPLTDAALAGALQTMVEAKVQALAAAQVPAGNGPGFATGTASDAIAVACPLSPSGPQGGASPGDQVEAFAGPATIAGSGLARAVYAAVLAGCLTDDYWR